jgi:very-short-patch-repair endonuclease
MNEALKIQAQQVFCKFEKGKLLVKPISKQFIYKYPEKLSLYLSIVATVNLHEEDTLPEVLSRLFNDIVETPKCSICGNFVSFRNFGEGYTKTCSTVCRHMLVSQKNKVSLKGNINGHYRVHTKTTPDTKASISNTLKVRNSKKSLFERTSKCSSYEELYELFKKQGYILVDFEKENYKCVTNTMYCLNSKGFYVRKNLDTIFTRKADRLFWRNKYAETNVRKLLNDFYPSYVFVSGDCSNVKNIINIKYLGSDLPKEEDSVFKIPIANLMKGFPISHPYFTQPLGERLIKNYLISKNIDFSEQKTFKNLRDKGLLRYDFYIPSKNMLLEFDGEQHIRYISKYHKNKENFQALQKRDAMKTDYAISQGFRFERIPYKEIANLTSILDRIFN